MFVRFRKVPNGGFRSYAVAHGAALRACRYPDHWGACRGGCSAKPRCRWVIGKHHQLSPYRLKVVLVENKRVNSKVKQETIAVLGSIDATWLPEFWKDAPADLKCKDWELYSLRARTAFWDKANKRLKPLANRLGPDMKRIRMAAHKRVPWPKEPERKRLELLEAKDDYDFFKRDLEFHQGQVARGKEAVKAAQASLAIEQEIARNAAVSGVEAARKLAKLSIDSS